ncbi:MAG: zinc ribbon domain-containing protein [Thaumarchaeota archaeon]|nr:zinc ribbon domain-containing protein [Nitrososphaerota archaeon]
MEVRSFILSAQSMSLCVSKEIKEMGEGELAGAVGVDRNLENLTVGNAQAVTYYVMKELVDIGERTRDIIHSFKRNDAKVRKEISSKYGKRRSTRTKQYLNLISKKVVQDAKANKQAIVFEDITRINRLYRRGNGQSRSYRFMMNSWPFYEIKRQIEYKAAWEGVQVITLTKGETRGTTMDCPRCGERLQVPVRGDEEHYRQLWCEVCRKWTARDVVAVLNISRRGRLRFDRSERKEGGAEEAVKGNAGHDGEPLILRVDASKLRQSKQQTQ